MLRGLISIRADTPAEHIRAFAYDETCRGIRISPGLRVEQIEAVDDLLASHPNMTVAVNSADAFPALCRLRNARWIQIFFSQSDDPIENTKLLPALRLPRLRGLRLHAYWLHDLALLHDLPPELESLCLDAETDRPKVGLDSLHRFRHLRRLTLFGPCKGLEALAELKDLRELSLQHVGAGTHAFLAPLKAIEHLRLGGGSLADLSIISALPELRLLSLFDMKQLCDASALSDCNTLQWLELDTMPRLKGMPSFAKTRRLLVLLIESLGGLVDFSGVSSAPALELFSFVSGRKTAARPPDLLPVLKVPSLRHVKAGFGSTRLNDEFARLASQYGKAWNAPDLDTYRARVALSSP
jgi:hypothetical protein